MKAKIVLAVLILITLFVCASCSSSYRLIDTTLVDATLISIEYTDAPLIDELDRKLCVDSPALYRQGRVWATSEQAALLVIGRRYHFVLETWSGNWGSYYLLVEATSLADEVN